jgi:hypothetical protein
VSKYKKRSTGSKGSKGGKGGKGSVGVSDDAEGIPKVVWKRRTDKLYKRSVVLCVYGDTHTGKSSLALSAPGPIAIIHFAENLEGRIQLETSRGKDIREVNFGSVFKGTPTEISKQARRSLDLALLAIDDAMSWAKTIIIDTHSSFWDVIQLAAFGSLNASASGNNRKGQLIYTELNNLYESTIRKFLLQDSVNLVLVGKTKLEYKKSRGSKNRKEATGNTVHKCQKDTEFLSEIVLRTFYSDEGEFSCELVKPWWDGSLKGLVVEGEDSNFPSILSLITNTDESEWS